MRELNGKVAVVTGAASGIGRGMAEAFAAAGMKVVLADVERPALEATSNAMKAAGHDVHPVVTDVSDRDSIDALAHEAGEHYGNVQPTA